MRTSDSITYCYLCSQSVELLRWRLLRIFRRWQLSLANRMHDFYAGNRTAGRPERLEPEHGAREAFHCSMVLFYDVSQIFRAPDDNGSLRYLVVVRNRRC